MCVVCDMRDYGDYDTIQTEEGDFYSIVDYMVDMFFWMMNPIAVNAA